MARTAIRHVHRTCGICEPVDSEAVRQVRRGLRQTYGAAPRPLARPLSVEEIRTIVVGIDRTTPIGIRDAEMILLGHASAIRRVGSNSSPAGLLLNIRQSKVDQEGNGQQVAHGQHALTDPVAALGSWRAVRGDVPGALHPHLGTIVSLEPLSGHVPARMLPREQKPPTSTAPASPPTPCAPDMPRPRHWPESP